MILSPLSNRFEILAFMFVIEVDKGFGSFLVPPDLERLEVNITFLIIFSSIHFQIRSWDNRFQN